jgi:hypothetical protein
MNLVHTESCKSQVAEQYLTIHEQPQKKARNRRETALSDLRSRNPILQSIIRPYIEMAITQLMRERVIRTPRVEEHCQERQVILRRKAFSPWLF